MRKQVITIAVGAMMALTSGAQEVSVFILDHLGPFTNVRNDAVGGRVVDYIPVDASAMLQVDNPQNGWWHIVGDSYQGILDDDLEEVRLKGSDGGYWVHYSVIAATTRNYGDQKLNLLSEPKDRAAATYTLSEPQDVRPVDVKGDWVKVKTLDGRHSGWILGVWLCGNSVTTCP